MRSSRQTFYPPPAPAWLVDTLRRPAHRQGALRPSSTKPLAIIRLFPCCGLRLQCRVPNCRGAHGDRPP